MRTVLLLSPYPDRLEPIFKQHGDRVVIFDGDVNQTLFDEKFDCVVSYGYQKIIRKEFIARYPERIFNLHISLLPWNKGADPNFWSFVDATPSGVTIHLIDSGLDTGPILAQREVEFADLHKETLASTYEQLQREIVDLFANFWSQFSKTGTLELRPQEKNAGTTHRVRDKETLFSTLPNRWNTTIYDLISRTQPEPPKNYQQLYGGLDVAEAKFRIWTHKKREFHQTSR